MLKLGEKHVDNQLILMSFDNGKPFFCSMVCFKKHDVSIQSVFVCFLFNFWYIPSGVAKACQLSLKGLTTPDPFCLLLLIAYYLQIKSPSKR